MCMNYVSRPGQCPKHEKQTFLICRRCIVETIRGLPDQDWLVRDLKTNHNITLDRGTIQIVLNVLDQKLGIF